ncbi:hypothetical protein MHBO_005023 [Bonamia ostreae]|uniref:Ribosomal protein L27 n=1 Tax=Bonamia ostreae TaxID=126728 RepID=A0ABV2AUU8_9EUKA
MFFGLLKLSTRNATKTSKGNTKSKRSPAGKRLGLKKWNQQPVISGNIILRQKGMKWRPGQNVGMGRDQTIFSFITGRVAFTKEKVKTFRGMKRKTFVHVVRPGDDVSLFSTERSNRKTWKKPCPLNLKWDEIFLSNELKEKALKMMENDLSERERAGLKRFSRFSQEMIAKLRDKSAV